MSTTSNGTGDREIKGQQAPGNLGEGSGGLGLGWGCLERTRDVRERLGNGSAFKGEGKWGAGESI